MTVKRADSNEVSNIRWWIGWI